MVLKRRTDLAEDSKIRNVDSRGRNIVADFIQTSENYNWTDCSWRGRVYCDGDLVIVSSAANQPTFTKNAIIEGFVPVVVQDGL